MRIAYGPEAFFQKYGGVSKYFLKLAEGLARRGHDVEIFSPLFATEGLRILSDARNDGRFFSPNSRWSLATLRTASILAGRAQMGRFRPDIFHPTYYSLMDSFPSPGNKIVTVYDFVHEKMGGRSTVETELTKLRKRATINRADLVLTISESTRNDLLELYPRIDPEKVVVTWLGVDQKPPHISVGSPSEGEQIILWVGARAGYKNFQVVSEAFKLLPKSSLREVELVVFGGGPLQAEEVQRLVDCGLKPAQISQVFGDDDLLAQYYGKARMLLYTSKYEGFGLPILEAMAAGCPVICSGTSSMPEVAGNAALIVDPNSHEDVAAAIRELLEKNETFLRCRKRGFRRAAEFSWDDCVIKTEKAYLRVLDS